MATYNGSIKVLPCNEINIPQPGTLVEVPSDIATFEAMIFTRDPFGTKDSFSIEAPTEELYQLFLNQKISGTDVIYLTKDGDGKAWPLQIESVVYEFNGGSSAAGSIKNIDFAVQRTLCSPPSNIEWIPSKGVGVAFGIQIYRGNYSTTTGWDPDSSGYSGAGNSDGYALSYQSLTPLTLPVDVLTVNNDKVPLVITPSPQELKVVKVFCPNETCPEYDEGEGYESNIYAFSFEF